MLWRKAVPALASLSLAATMAAAGEPPPQPLQAQRPTQAARPAQAFTGLEKGLADILNHPARPRSVARHVIQVMPAPRAAADPPADPPSLLPQETLLYVVYNPLGPRIRTPRDLSKTWYRGLARAARFDVLRPELVPGVLYQPGNTATLPSPMVPWSSTLAKRTVKELAGNVLGYLVSRETEGIAIFDAIERLQQKKDTILAHYGLTFFRKRLQIHPMLDFNSDRYFGFGGRLLLAGRSLDFRVYPAGLDAHIGLLRGRVGDDILDVELGAYRSFQGHDAGIILSGRIR